MKRVIAVILVLCMALSLCACSSSGSGSASGEKVIKIGVFEPSSGDSASGGKKEILGMQYANSRDAHRRALGGETYKVELVYGRQRLLHRQGSLRRLLIWSARACPWFWAPTVPAFPWPAAPSFDEAGIPAIGITCTNPNVTAGNELLLPYLLPG